MLVLVLSAAAIVAASGLPGLVVGRRSAGLSAALATAGGLLGAAASLVVLAQGGEERLDRPWGLPIGALAFRLDPLAAAFLAPLFVVALLGAVYGYSYFGDDEHPASAPRMRLLYGVLVGAMALVFVARDGVLFLVAWELMALSAFFLIVTEDRDAAARSAGWVYLVATHTGTLFLLLLFARLQPGGLGPDPLLSSAEGGAPLLLFGLAFLGFGLKAGVVPLHFWLPGAHAHAPSHVSALLSGVMLKTGLYGILRISSILPPMPAAVAYGVVLLGGVSALTGIVLALGQRDLKRALAYSSVENVGIVLLGIGLALLGRSRGIPAWQHLGVAAATFHVWSHALFKSLLFLGAGTVLHGAGTRDLEMLGGLGKTMPRTAGLFSLGAAAASALPFTTAFASEWMLYGGYLELLRSAGPDAAVALVVPMLALVGALAVAGFVRLFAVVFLGERRGPVGPSGALHDPPLPMLLPMGALALLVVLLGIAPELLRLPLGRVAATYAGMPEQVAAIGWTSLPILSRMAAALAATTGLLALLFRAVQGSAPVRRAGTWDCGYALPTNRMQYTARSMGEWWAERLAPRFLRPVVRLPDLSAPGTGSPLFPGSAELSIESVEPFGEGLYTPLLVRWSERFARLRRLQQASLSASLLLVLITLVALLAWSAIRWKLAPS